MTDAVVVGSGPNGLAAAITLARAGRSVVVLEAAEKAGGGMRSEEATLPGFVHDLCSAVHPLAIASEFFRSTPLEQHGLEWIVPPSQVAHPLENGEAGLIDLSVETTASRLGRDGNAYRELFAPLAEKWSELFSEILQPVLHFPRHPFLLTRFGLNALWPADALARKVFRDERARALFLGIAAHANAPLKVPGTAAIGLMLNVAAHAKGWPIPRGGSQKIAGAMISYLRSLGGEVRTGTEIRSRADLPKSRLVFFDLGPRQIAKILGDALPAATLSAFTSYKQGPGVFKMDWALAEPIPWKDKSVARSATVHLGGAPSELVLSESLPLRGVLAEKPYVLLAQPSLFDATRAPRGQHTAWAYCHVPNGSTADMSVAIEDQVERFAPGFRSTILARRQLAPKEIEAKNMNLVGGDISGGGIDLVQLLFRPRFGINPYRLPLPGHYICSASTPPGPGVHGMCGFNAAVRALAEN